MVKTLYLLLFLITASLGATCSFRVMQFNIEDGGALVSMAQVVHIIQKEHADVVCIQESEGRIAYIASLVGWPYYNIRQRVISKFPIIDPEDTKGLYVFIELEPGRIVAVSNVHLPSDSYGPYLLEKGASIKEVEQVEKNVRLSALQSHLDVLPKLAKQKIPVFLSGDFNTPSTLDSKSVKWPVSIALQQAGFRDSYREVHGNVEKHRGFTWWALRPKVPGWNPSEDDPHDRIDFIYVNGPAKTISSKVVGTKAFSPWPSDHKVVVSSFHVEPQHAPIYVAPDKRLINMPESVTVYYNGPKTETLTLVLSQSDKPIAKKKVKSHRGVYSFATKHLKKGRYKVALVSKSGRTLSSDHVVLKAHTDTPALTLAKDLFATTDPIEVSWKNAPGHTWDWVGIFSQDTNTNEPIMAHYLHAEIEGTYQFDSTTQNNFPLAPGRYKASFFIDDARKEVTHCTFQVCNSSVNS
ncbi:MAG: endonuclease/exonuclease/phosphatase family protein [Chlamydiales bacterium]|nr:endonuclease/exonuclease/phosphatase family protein [Chlamydiales bacterium]